MPARSRCGGSMRASPASAATACCCGAASLRSPTSRSPARPCARAPPRSSRRLRRRLAPLTDLALAGPTLRQRLYPLGMAQAVLLDRLRPGWKKEFETTEKFLDELLADAVGFPTGDNVAVQTVYQRALQGSGVDWKGIQEQVRREMAARARGIGRAHVRTPVT